MKRLVRDIADANISVTCMPITCAATFDLKKFWNMVTWRLARLQRSSLTHACKVTTVDPDMDTYDEDTGAFSWSLQERRHIAQSFKQRSLATLPLRFSGTSTAAAPPVTPTHRRSLQHHGASFLSRHGGEKARSQVTFCTLAFAIFG